MQAGKNPTKERKAEKLRKEIMVETTFEAATQRWLAIKQHLDSKYREVIDARLRLYILPRIGALPLDEIRKPVIARLLEDVAAKGTVETARRVKQIIHQVFCYAEQRGMCDHNPANNMQNILPPSPDKHFAAVPPSQFPTLLRKMENYQGELLTKAALHLLALTFVRTSELIGARWDEIDLNRAEWNISPDRMKMNRPHVVPLSRQSIEWLEQLCPLTGDKEHVFHSPRGKAGHISNGAVLMALRRMGYQGKMTGHGFRALASTILNENGYPSDIIERQLAHEERNKIRAAYNRAEYLLERKKMMQDYADLLDAMRESDGGNVVSMRMRTK